MVLDPNTANFYLTLSVDPTSVWNHNESEMINEQSNNNIERFADCLVSIALSFKNDIVVIVIYMGCLFVMTFGECIRLSKKFICAFITKIKHCIIKEQRKCLCICLYSVAISKDAFNLKCFDNDMFIFKNHKS